MTEMLKLYIKLECFPFVSEFTLGSFCSVVDVMNFSKLRVLRLEGNEISAGDMPSDAALCLRLASDIAV